MNKQQPLLQINNLSLAYGAKEILKAVHLTVCPGEILGIVGSSGGGKSTLLKTLTGLLPANAVITGGEILWQGHSLLSGGRLNSSGLLGRKLSMIFQDPTHTRYESKTGDGPQGGHAFLSGYEWRQCLNWLTSLTHVDVTYYYLLKSEAPRDIGFGRCFWSADGPGLRPKGRGNAVFRHNNPHRWTGPDDPRGSCGCS